VAHFKQAHKAPEHGKELEPPVSQSAQPERIIAIGASTGGTDAIRDILVQFGNTVPGIVVVQHMPPVFTRMFAQRLDSECTIKVKEAEDGDEVLPGRALIAPGGRQMHVRRVGRRYRIALTEGRPVCGHCPSVEVLMLSVAEAAGDKAIGVMLTGMGRDGAGGMKAMRNAGGRTIAQDEESSVVFGMPKEAYDGGGAEGLVPLEKIPAKVLALIGESRR
jgi:two-component system chemotaxis response regulator CheB